MLSYRHLPLAQSDTRSTSYPSHSTIPNSLSISRCSSQLASRNLRASEYTAACPHPIAIPQAPSDAGPPFVSHSNPATIDGPDSFAVISTTSPVQPQSLPHLFPVHPGLLPPAPPATSDTKPRVRLPAPHQLFLTRGGRVVGLEEPMKAQCWPGRAGLQVCRRTAHFSAYFPVHHSGPRAQPNACDGSGPQPSPPSAGHPQGTAPATRSVKARSSPCGHETPRPRARLTSDRRRRRSRGDAIIRLGCRGASAFRALRSPSVRTAECFHVAHAMARPGAREMINAIAGWSRARLALCVSGSDCACRNTYSGFRLMPWCRVTIHVSARSTRRMSALPTSSFRR
jgi:hypothetical protein